MQCLLGYESPSDSNDPFVLLLRRQTQNKLDLIQFLIVLSFMRYTLCCGRMSPQVTALHQLGLGNFLIALIACSEPKAEWAL